MKKYISMDIGGTMIKYGVINEKHIVEEFYECATEAHKGGVCLIEKVKKIVQKEQKRQMIYGICISTAGIVDAIKGEIIYANDSIPDYSGMKVKEILEYKCGIPCEVENDVNCAGLSEQFAGAAQGSKVTVCLTIGTGIGGCILIEDKVFRGFSNSAGEVGYMRVGDEDFQSKASSRALVNQVNAIKGYQDKKRLNGQQIFELAKSGDQICKDAIAGMCETLGYGIANICCVVNPEVVVLGGGIMKQREYLQPLLQASLEKYLVEPIREHVRLTFAQNDNKAGMIGAYFNFQKRQREIRDERI